MNNNEVTVIVIPDTPPRSAAAATTVGANGPAPPSRINEQQLLLIDTQQRELQEARNKLTQTEEKLKAEHSTVQDLTARLHCQQQAYNCTVLQRNWWCHSYNSASAQILAEQKTCRDLTETLHRTEKKLCETDRLLQTQRVFNHSSEKRDAELARENEQKNAALISQLTTELERSQKANTLFEMKLKTLEVKCKEAFYEAENVTLKAQVTDSRLKLEQTTMERDAAIQLSKNIDKELCCVTHEVTLLRAKDTLQEEQQKELRDTNNTFQKVQQELLDANRKLQEELNEIQSMRLHTVTTATTTYGKKNGDSPTAHIHAINNTPSTELSDLNQGHDCTVALSEQMTSELKSKEDINKTDFSILQCQKLTGTQLILQQITKERNDAIQLIEDMDAELHRLTDEVDYFERICGTRSQNAICVKQQHIAAFKKKKRKIYHRNPNKK